MNCVMAELRASRAQDQRTRARRPWSSARRPGDVCQPMQTAPPCWRRPRTRRARHIRAHPIRARARCAPAPRRSRTRRMVRSPVQPRGGRGRCGRFVLGRHVTFWCVQGCRIFRASAAATCRRTCTCRVSRNDRRGRRGTSGRHAGHVTAPSVHGLLGHTRTGAISSRAGHRCLRRCRRS